MAISFAKPTIESTPPEPRLDTVAFEAWREAEDAKVNAIGDAAQSCVSALNGLSAQAVANLASATGLTGASIYRYIVLSPVTATYGGVITAEGTGTAIMALTASADLLLLTIPIQ